MAHSDRSGLVPALLKQWRSKRGLSQLDLALAADVSARHISFLETGRSLPSREMVLLLGSTLGVPLGQVDAMLAAAGHEPMYADEAGSALPPQISAALRLLARHHEPFPLLVIDQVYDVVDTNVAAARLIDMMVGAPADPVPATDAQAAPPLNLARLTFDPAGAQPFIANFDEVGRELLWRIQREVLADVTRGGLAALLDELLAMPTVSPQWRDVDLEVPSDPVLVLHLRNGELDLRFLTTVTAFQAPQNVAVEQLRIEHWFPYDDATAVVCRQLAAS